VTEDNGVAGRTPAEVALMRRAGEWAARVTDRRIRADLDVMRERLSEEEYAAWLLVYYAGFTRGWDVQGADDHP
jgi:hypothetical protein